MVTKERLRSLQLDYIIAQEWNRTDTQQRYPLYQLEIRRTAASPALFEFLKQDHVPFWNFENNPLSAVLLTDTSTYTSKPRISITAIKIYNLIIFLYTKKVNGEEFKGCAE